MYVCVCTCVHVYVCVDNSLVPGRGAIMACLRIDSKQLLSQWEVVGVLSTVSLLPHAIGIHSRENAL